MYFLNFRNVYNLCNKYHWFESGTVEQYNKLFDLVAKEMPVEVIATVVWLCTDDEKWSLDDILSEFYCLGI